MKEKNKINAKIAVIGGDRRQAAAAEYFAGQGYNVVIFGVSPADCYDLKMADTLAEALYDADIAVLGLPYSNDGVKLCCPGFSREIRIQDILNPQYTSLKVFGGRLDPSAYALADVYGIRLFDYYDREELCVLNAIPTAEGALAIALNEMKTTIHGSYALITGYGRIGRVLSGMLKALGCRVIVSARHPSDLAWAESQALSWIHTSEISSVIPEADVIFNTIPHTIFCEPELSRLRSGVPLIDLASKPGGVDLEAAKRLGTNLIWALSLPGKVAPITAGHYIARTIIHMLEDNVSENDSRKSTASEK